MKISEVHGRMVDTYGSIAYREWVELFKERLVIVDTECSVICIETKGRMSGVNLSYRRNKYITCR